MSELYQVLRDPFRFMEVGIPLPVDKPPANRAQRRRAWPWTLLAIVVVSFGIVYLLYLGGRIHGTPDDNETGNVDGGDNNGTTSAPTSFEGTNPPTMTPNNASDDDIPMVSPAPTRAPGSQTTIPPVFSQDKEPLVYTGWCSSDTPCFECEGQCFVDDDCFENLVCFIRIGYDEVPGCFGPGIFGVSYCHRPADPPLIYERECSSADPCGLCEGDCDQDADCEEGLACMERSESEPVPGCAGEGVAGKDYCITLYGLEPTAEPTRRPTVAVTPVPTQTLLTPRPTPPPAQQPTAPEQETQLYYVGPCSETSQCDVCQGECNDDDGCLPGLLCFQRPDFTSVPGCSGAAAPGMNFCYKPDQPVLYGTGDCLSSSPCKMCQGDCDRDSDCDGPGLLCFQREGSEPVPGCSGLGIEGKDYCYEAFTNPDSLQADRDCTVDQPCGKCQGDCMFDADCQVNLVCFRRTADEPVPGCVTGGSGDIAQANYCHEPLDGGPVSYIPGQLTVNENGLLLSTGLTSRIIATYGQPVTYDIGGQSTIPFHKDPDAGAVFETSDGGWIYVSNSEDDPGGVGAIRFDRNGAVTNYQMIATKTTDNCGGGKTWWETWLTCEEKSGGHVWEVDPYGIKPERMTIMGSGRFESAAYYRPTPSTPTFYITEDVEGGALRRFTPDRLAVTTANQQNDFSELLHSNTTGTAKIEYLKLFPETEDSGTFQWTDDHDAARVDAAKYYSFSEGIDIARGVVYVTAKKPKKLLTLDLEDGKYEISSTESGAFDKQPDQVKFILGDDASDDILFFCEDGGENSGVHGRDSSGLFYNILDGKYDTETSGLAFSPDSRFMYVSYQENPGIIFEVKRRDGYPFSGTRLDIKYSKVKS